MRIQAYLTAFVVNVKRMVKLIEQKQPIPQMRIDCFFLSRDSFFHFLSFTSIKLRLLQGSLFEAFLLKLITANMLLSLLMNAWLSGSVNIFV